MNQHGCRGVVLQSSLDDFPGIDAGTVQSAPEQFVKDDHPVPAVEQKQGEYLMLVVAQQRLQVGLVKGQATNCRAVSKARCLIWAPWPNQAESRRYSVLRARRS